MTQEKITEERDYYQSVLNQSHSHVNRDQVKQLEQHQEKKNVIHRQNEEHYLQRGFLTEPITGRVERMTPQNTFTRPIKVIKLSKFGEYYLTYNYIYTVLVFTC